MDGLAGAAALPISLGLCHSRALGIYYNVDKDHRDSGGVIALKMPDFHIAAYTTLQGMQVA
ncbi:hypothetical protein EGR_10459 [Echinococcus granulosus]|uniref:Uncharacterized protein n=1 Tax=Echinococcus granulosus TaxID=6210 RepID=W6U8C6_ECHGR|nr:hypothetical protein EGR_10459 [Echinococcus granulosus]EUB54677.1 hypothetical protein EGR_10459 [Echinococcus granulosus]